MAQITSINKHWLYNLEDIAGAQMPDFDDSAWTRINIPHTNKLLPHNSFDDMEYQFISWYRKKLHIPELASERRNFLDFDGVMIACEVFVNGKKLAEHKGGYTPFSVDITSEVEPGTDALVAVRVDSTERKDIPPFGGMVDYLTFGGIYRDVKLRMCSRSYISDVFARSVNVLMSPALEADVVIEGPSEEQTVMLHLKELSGTQIAEKQVPVIERRLTLSLHDLKNIKLWSIEEPNLYIVEVILRDAGCNFLDSYSFKFGFREARFCEDGAFRLNGNVVKLMGLDRHQMFPYIGQAAPARLQRRDADILKYDLSLNIIRTSHYPQSPHFLDRCDEIGLLVFEEIPGWQHIGDEDWKNISKRDVRDMIVRDRNHPSIVLWGVRCTNYIQ